MKTPLDLTDWEETAAIKDLLKFGKSNSFSSQFRGTLSDIEDRVTSSEAISRSMVEDGVLVPDHKRLEKYHNGRTPAPNLGALWSGRAERNIKRWGNQDALTLFLALAEELGEVAQELSFGATLDIDTLDEDEEDRLYSVLEFIEASCLDARTFLEETSEDEEGNPLPSDERPPLITKLENEEAVLEELNDLAPLVYQLRWALEEEARDDDDL